MTSGETDEGASATRAAVEVLAAAGIAVREQPAVLPGVANVVLGFPGAGVVTKVATRPRAIESLPKEHAIALELAALGAATSRPVADLSPVVHESTGFMVTVWHHVDHDPTATLPARSFTRALTDLHAALDETTTPVPPFTDDLAAARGALDNDDFMSALAPSDRGFLRDAFDRGLEELAARPHERHRLHGEPHEANRLVTGTGGVVWVDFESCCSGPREWDLSFMAPDTVQDGGDVDHGLLACLRRLNHARFATWRWGLLRHHPDLLDHARADLAFLRS